MFSPNCVVVLPAPEISIKSSAVRSFMLNKLKKNMVLCLKHFGVDYECFVSLASRVIIKSKEPKNVMAALSKCFGINYFALAQEVSFDSLEDLCAKGVAVSTGSIEKGTFAVRGKSFSKGFSSKKLEEELGRNLLDRFSNLKVKLKGSEHELHCVSFNASAYFYFDFVDGAKGMPLGTQGRVGLVVSKGTKATAVATLSKNLMKYGCVVAIVSDSKTSAPKELAEFNCFKEIKVFSVKEAEEFYSSGDIIAFFSTARALKEAEQASKLVGVKVFAPLLV